MKYLITQKFMKDVKKRYGIAFPKERRTGKSTALALRALATCINNPGKSFKIKDHHPTVRADLQLLRLITNMIEAFDLHGFEINRTKLEIKFNLFEPGKSSVEYVERL